MTADRIDGAAIAAAIRGEVADRVRAHVAAGGTTPQLTAVLVGDDPASATYVRNKARACEEVGLEAQTLTPPADISQDELLEIVRGLNADPAVSGILVQLPLPPQLDERVITEAVDPAKDVDGLHPVNLGRLVQGEPHLVPATPAGVQQLLLRTGVDPAGKRVVVVGRSTLVGKPLALLLGQKAEGANATVTLAHTGTSDLAAVTREAEILVVAAGWPNTVTAEMVRPGGGG
ncbi:MAG: bifunctional 5,10-methylenetetrahydrofolate dehydrogenase/5,10-methenyltetrahydrofolate cyclohydrolase [Chloroflexi bacterium]|nr:bifunctional 5,10-methylenetetrahydrofolate dehydrogenase/5,10-methenyltetrahydrofolate cyclohydrolase [Chloroflexota bacterium]